MYQKMTSNIPNPKPKPKTKPKTMAAISAADVNAAKLTLKLRIAIIKEQLTHISAKEKKAAMAANKKEDMRLYHEYIYEGADEVAHFQLYLRELERIIANPNPTLEMGECLHLLGILNSAGTFNPKDPHEATVVIVRALKLK